MIAHNFFLRGILGVNVAYAANMFFSGEDYCPDTQIFSVVFSSFH
jgi:hypothetical protein